MHRRLLVLLALCALAIAVPATAAAKPAKGKAMCSLKKKAKCKKAKLKNVKVGKQNLTGVNLAGATISGSTFTGTTLRNVDLTNATLTNVTFKDVDLGGAVLAGAKLVNVRFDHVDASQGASPRVCDLKPEFSWSDSCNLPGLFADGATVKGGTIYDSTFQRSSWRGVTFDGVKFLVCNLDQSTFVNSVWKRAAGIFGGRHEDQLRTTVNGTRFDYAQMLSLMTVDGSNASFLGTTFAVQEDNVLKDPRGLAGARTVTLAPAYDSTPTPGAMQLRETGFWRVGNLCVAERSCAYTAAVGMPLVVTVMSSTPLDLSIAGLSCARTESSGLYTTTCSTTSLPAGGSLAATYAVPPPVTKSVTVNIEGYTADRIAIETLTAAGTVATTKACTAASTCSTNAVVGSTVRLVFTVSSPAGDAVVVDLPSGVFDTAPTPTPVSDWATKTFTLSDDTTFTVWIS